VPVALNGFEVRTPQPAARSATASAIPRVVRATRATVAARC